MNPITHGLIGYLTAEAGGLDTRRDRAMVTLAGIVPDVDGFGALAEIATRDSETPLLWWSTWHHVLAHNLAFALLWSSLAFALATRRLKVFVLAFLSFHFHILGDLVGGKGPDGSQWPIHYLWPFSAQRGILTWEGQWELNAWPNVAITVAALAMVFYLAWRRGYSPLGLLSERADRVFVETLRGRFGMPACTRS